MKNINNNPLLVGSAMFTLSVILFFIFEPGITAPVAAISILLTFAAAVIFLTIGITRLLFKDSETAEHEHWIN